MDDKKVILTLEEYQKLKTDSETLQTAKEELKKDCKERGYYVELPLRYDGLCFEYYRGDRWINLSKPLTIISKDEVLKVANETIEGLQLDKEALLRANKELGEKIDTIQGRNLLQRIFNKH